MFPVTQGTLHLIRKLSMVFLRLQAGRFSRDISKKWPPKALSVPRTTSNWFLFLGSFRGVIIKKNNRNRQRSRLSYIYWHSSQFMQKKEVFLEGLQCVKQQCSTWWNFTYVINTLEPYQIDPPSTPSESKSQSATAFSGSIIFFLDSQQHHNFLWGDDWQGSEHPPNFKYQVLTPIREITCKINRICIDHFLSCDIGEWLCADCAEGKSRTAFFEHQKRFGMLRDSRWGNLCQFLVFFKQKFPEIARKAPPFFSHLSSPMGSVVTIL